MNVATAAYAKRNLSELMSDVCKNSDPVIVSGHKHKVVMISLDDFNGIIETCRLLANPANEKHLDKSIKQAEQGNFVDVKLI